MSEATATASKKSAAKASAAKASAAKKSAPVKAAPAPAAAEPKERVSTAFLQTLSALSDGSKMSSAEITAVTGKVKGNRQRDLTEAGLIETLEAGEGERGQRFKITAAGKAYLKQHGHMLKAE